MPLKLTRDAVMPPIEEAVADGEATEREYDYVRQRLREIAVETLSSSDSSESEQGTFTNGNQPA